MNLFKRIFTYIFFNIVKLVFKFWNIQERNVKYSKDFEYIDFKSEEAYYDSKNYFVYNKKKSFNFLSFNKIKINKYFYYKINKAYGLSHGDYPIFLNERFKLIYESINLDFENLCSSTFIKTLIVSFISKPKTILKEVICFSGIYDNNKYHFILDYLPRLQHIIENNLQNNFIYIVNKKNLDFIKFYLINIGINENNILVWKQDYVLIKSLHIFSFRYKKYKKNKIYEINSLKSILWIRDFFLKKFDNILINNSFNKILILRKKNDQRRIINSKKFVKYLDKYKFKLFYLEDLSENKIIEIFKSAKVLVTVNGAGLSNIIFSKGLKIIEIYPELWPEENAFIFYQLSRYLKFEHHLFIAKQNNKKEGMTIDIELFKKTLENQL